MQISEEMLQQYLTLVNDPNPIHQDIVPGQLVVEIVFAECNITWQYFKIKYVEPIEINEQITISDLSDSCIIVSNADNGVKGETPLRDMNLPYVVRVECFVSDSAVRGCCKVVKEAQVWERNPFAGSWILSTRR